MIPYARVSTRAHAIEKVCPTEDAQERCRSRYLPSSRSRRFLDTANNKDEASFHWLQLSSGPGPSCYSYFGAVAGGPLTFRELVAKTCSVQGCFADSLDACPSTPKLTQSPATATTYKLLLRLAGCAASGRNGDDNAVERPHLLRVRNACDCSAVFWSECRGGSKPRTYISNG